MALRSQRTNVQLGDTILAGVSIRTQIVLEVVRNFGSSEGEKVCLYQEPNLTGAHE